MTDALVVWCPPDRGATTHPLVTEADRQRASRFRLRVDASRHLTGRVLARRAGASWSGVDPAEVHVATEPEGRPILVDHAGAHLAAHVSITHAGDLVGVAVAGSPVGLDVQDVAAFHDLLGSPDLWTPTEIADLARTDPAVRLQTAATWWTAKEAVLKSLGRGLLDPVETLEVRDCPVHWHALDPGPGHAAAIAGAAAVRQVRLRHLADPIDV